MNLVIFGKIAGAILVVGTASVGVVAIVNVKNWDFVNVYAISATVSDGADTEIKHDNKNFKCKFKGDDINKAFDCDVHQLKTDDEKKQHKDKYKVEDNGPTKDTLKTEHKVFQIKFNGTHLFDKPNHDNNIEIIHKETGNKKYADLKQLFNVYRGKARGKTDYFVAQASSSTSAAITAANTFKCSFSDTAGTKQACAITEFSASDSSPVETNDYTTLTFQKPSTTTITTITEHRYYLIQFPNSSDSNTKTKIEDFAHDKIYTSVDTNTEITFHKVKPVVYDSNYDHLFVI